MAVADREVVDRASTKSCPGGRRKACFSATQPRYSHTSSHNHLCCSLIIACECIMPAPAKSVQTALVDGFAGSRATSWVGRSGQLARIQLTAEVDKALVEPPLFPGPGVHRHHFVRRGLVGSRQCGISHCGVKRTLRAVPVQTEACRADTLAMGRPRGK